MKSKILGTKEFIMLVFPVLTGIFIYILATNLFESFVPSELWKVKINKIPAFPPVVYEKHNFLGKELFENAIRVVPYSIPETTVPEDKTTGQQPPPKYKLSFIYIGKNRYVIINGKLYSEGEKLPSDEKIVRITKNGVLLKGKWGDRWVRLSDF